MEYSMRGGEIVRLLENRGIAFECDPGFEETLFSDLCQHPDLAKRGGLFFDILAKSAEGNLEKAIRNGAVGCICDSRRQAAVPCLYTERINEAAAYISQSFYRYHPSALNLIGVTGTKGKTTTVRFLYDILTAAKGKPVAYGSTRKICDGRQFEVPKYPSTDPTIFYDFCARAVENGCEDLVIELASYADRDERLIGLSFKYGIFTNLDYDHISPTGHPSYEAYAQCKKNIVARYETALINRDEPRFEEFMEAAKHAKNRMTYSAAPDPNADFYAEDVQKVGMHHRFTLVTPSWRYPMEISMPGGFNVSNAVAACAVGWMMGLDASKMAEGILNTQVEGRMKFYERNGYAAVVDFAHNGLSFNKVFQALKEDFPERKVLVITGIGGRSSPFCRRDIARSVAEHAALCYITTDNPRDEDPAELCAELERRIRENGGRSEIIPDREAAIRIAIERLQRDEILLVAGKADERFMDYWSVKEPYDGDTVLTEKYMLLK